MQRLLFFFSLYNRTEKSYDKTENTGTFLLYNFIWIKKNNNRTDSVWKRRGGAAQCKAPGSVPRTIEEPKSAGERRRWM